MTGGGGLGNGHSASVKRATNAKDKGLAKKLLYGQKLILR
jgi:hypothetical protein